MKNIIDFILESQGQRHRYRSTNKPYDVENDELVLNKKTREYKKDLQRLTTFFKEFNANLNDKYKNSIHAFVFPHNSDLRISSFFTNAYTGSDSDSKQMIQFSGTDAKLSKDTVKYYDVLKNPDWLALCDFENMDKTPAYDYERDRDIYGYRLKIANKTLEMKYGTTAGLYVTKDGLQCFAFHDSNRRTGLEMIFTMDTNIVEEWEPDKIVKAVCARVYKRNGRSNYCIIDLEDLGKGKLTGKNFAEAFNHVLDTW